MAKIFRIHPEDNVAVAVQPLAKGETAGLDGQDFTAGSDIPAGHKMAIRAIRRGESVVKYGFPIGSAKEDIQPGDWVHTHNVQSRLGDLLSYEYHPEQAGNTAVANDREYTFMGYERRAGRHPQ